MPSELLQFAVAMLVIFLPLLLSWALVTFKSSRRRDRRERASPGK